MAAVSAVPRTRGGISGILLILLGAWGAIIPFVGPYFGYAYTPDATWTYTTGMLWLSILPGAAAFLGGIMVLLAAAPPGGDGRRVRGPGRRCLVRGRRADPRRGGRNRHQRPGVPVASPGSAFSAPVMRLLKGLGLFYGLGVLIVTFAAFVLGRFAVAAVRAGRDDGRHAPATIVRCTAWAKVVISAMATPLLSRQPRNSGAASTSHLRAKAKHRLAP